MFQEYNLQYLMCLTHCCQVFFYIEGLNRTSIHAQNNQSVLHALWPRRHCATAPSKDTFHGIFAILLFLPQASIHIQSFELHGMKTIPPPKKKNKRTSICISSTIMFNGFFDFFLANFPPCTPSNFPQLHLGPQRLLLHLLRVFASVETRCEFIKMWDTRHGSHTYPWRIHATGISTYIYRKKICQNVGKYTSPMDGIWASTKNIDFSPSRQVENTQGQCFFFPRNGFSKDQMRNTSEDLHPLEFDSGRNWHSLCHLRRTMFFLGSIVWFSNDTLMEEILHQLDNIVFFLHDLQGSIHQMVPGFFHQ